MGTVTHIYSPLIKREAKALIEYMTIDELYIELEHLKGMQHKALPSMAILIAEQIQVVTAAINLLTQSTK